ncbi:hypothetical protein OKW31_001060 [Paraburkholderia atlantica]
MPLTAPATLPKTTTGLPLSRQARFSLQPLPRHRMIRDPDSPPYFTAPPSNHAAIFIRSSSVMWVTLPSGIAFNVTACW